MNKKINIFIQARMSSLRYPGKILAPVFGKPLIKHIIEKANNLKYKNDIVVLTSNQESDDCVSAYLKEIGCKVFRGDLNNVFNRFKKALEIYPCDYVVRISADSPMIDVNLIDFMIDKCFSKEEYLIISNVFHRKFPKGQSVEIIKSSLLESIDSANLSSEEKEHVMPYFYKNINPSKGYFIELQKDLSFLNNCIDTFEDLQNIQNSNFKYIFNELDIKRVEVC